MVYNNPEAVMGRTLAETEHLDWAQVFAVLDNEGIIIAVVDSEDHFWAGHVDLDDYDFDEQDGVYRPKTGRA